MAQETVFDQYPLTMLADGRHYYVETPMHERDADEEYPEGLPVKQTKLRFNTECVIVYSTYSMHEYDRTNSEVDPVASSAEYELEKRIEKMDVFKVRCTAFFYFSFSLHCLYYQLIDGFVCGTSILQGNIMDMGHSSQVYFWLCRCN